MTRADPRAWPPPVGSTVVARNREPGRGVLVAIRGSVATVRLDGGEVYDCPVTNLRIVPRPEEP